MQINFEDIQPFGNFKSILENCRSKADSIIAQCHAEKAYRPSLAGFIKFIVRELGVLYALEDGIEKNMCWNNDEAMMCLLYTHLIIIDLNSTAHLYLNKIDTGDRKKQLQDLIKQSESDSSVYKNIKIK